MLHAPAVIIPVVLSSNKIEDHTVYVEIEQDRALVSVHEVDRLLVADAVDAEINEVVVALLQNPTDYGSCLGARDP